MELPEIETFVDGLPLVVRHRVLYGEVDRMDTAYGSHYLTWFESGRNEYLRRCGLPYTEIESRGLLLPVFESRVWHMAPIRYDDLLDIRCAIVSCTHARATFVFVIERDGERVAAGYTLHACLNRNRKPVRLPDWLKRSVLGRSDLKDIP
jgi:acyl-CoA thioester hydrolase